MIYVNNFYIYNEKEYAVGFIGFVTQNKKVLS